MNPSIKIVLAFFMCVSCLNLSAQKLMNLHKNALRKLENRVQEKMVDRGSEAAAQAVEKSIDKGFDNMMKESYREKYGEDLTDEQIDSLMYADGQTTNAFLRGMNASDKVAASYSFDYEVITEYTTEDGEKMKTKMHFAKDHGHLLIIDPEDLDQFTVFDVANDVMIVFNEKDKTGYAIGGILTMASAFGHKKQDKIEAAKEDLIIEGPLSSKRILGYSADLYKVETEEHIHKYYLSKDLPFVWHDAFKKMSQKFAPAEQSAMSESFEGMMLEGETYYKKKDKSSFVKTLSFEELATTIKKSDYLFSEY